MNRKVATVVLGIGLTFIGMPHAAFSQDNVPANEQVPTNEQQMPSSAQDQVQAPVVEEVAKKNGLVSIDFRDADIRNVLKVLAYNSGVNIVAGPEVTGLVTIQLKDVPWQKALDVVLTTYGYASERKGDIISVTTVENLKKRREDAQVLAEQESLETKTFILNFGKASEIIGSIEKMKTPRGSINFDQRTNTLIVTDIQSNLDLIGDVVKALDAVTPQVVIEVKVVETTLSNTENLGIDWTIKGTATGAKRPLTFPFHAQNSSEYLTGTFPATAATDFAFGTLNASSLSAVLEILKTRSNTNILSNPKIVTLDNQMARIVVGSQYPIPTYTYNEQQAKLQVSGWQYKDIGIIFEATPHVNNAGFVTIDLQPKITAILDFVTVENTSLPRLSTEETTTKVMIKDGDTLVIAGLIKDQVTETKKSVPILGDIPFLGQAFRKSETTKEKTELLIFLTPHIITPDISTASTGSKK